MNNQQQKDYDAVKQLREYYARAYDLKTDIEFMQWITDVMKLIRADDYKRVKATFEKRDDHPLLNKASDTIYICPTCGANQSAAGRTRPPVYCDECGADWPG